MAINRRNTWSKVETLVLLGIWRDEDVEKQLQNVHRNIAIYTRVAELLTYRGYDRTPAQCRSKLKALKHDYLRMKKILEKSGSSDHSIMGHEEFAIMNQVLRTLQNSNYLSDVLATDIHGHDDTVAAEHGMAELDMDEDESTSYVSITDDTGYECKLRWSSLRDQYRRHQRKISTKNGQETAPKGTYRYADEMSPVKPFLREREAVTHIKNEGGRLDTEDVDFTEDDEDVPMKKQKLGVGQERACVDESGQETKFETMKSDRSASQIPMKEPEPLSSVLMNYLVESDKKEEKFADPIDLFFKSVAVTVKQFSPYYQNVCKSKVFSVVSDLEMTQILGQNSTVVSTQKPTHITDSYIKK